MMAIRAVVVIPPDSIHVQGGVLSVDVNVHPATGDVLSETRTVTLSAIAGVSALVPALKAQLITFAQTHYGVTVTAEEIAVFGGPQ